MDVLKDKEYPVFTTNTSYEHILKVFPTKLIRKDEMIDTFQYTSDSGKGISDEDYPEATFSFEFDPLTIVISEVNKPFYHFITSLFAIIGGVVTVLSLIDSIFNKAELIFAEKEILGKNEWIGPFISLCSINRIVVGGSDILFYKSANYKLKGWVLNHNLFFQTVTNS